MHIIKKFQRKQIMPVSTVNGHCQILQTMTIAMTVMKKKVPMFEF